eukprot:13386528-Alexandrium_andersonii.AAC.1
MRPCWLRSSLRWPLAGVSLWSCAGTLMARSGCTRPLQMHWLRAASLMWRRYLASRGRGGAQAPVARTEPRAIAG